MADKDNEFNQDNVCNKDDENNNENNNTST